MRTFALLSVFALMTTPGAAQDATTPLNRAQSNPGDSQTIQQQVQNNLQQAGFTDIQIMPSSFLVRAKDRAGNPVMMVINPDSVTAVTEIPAQQQDPQSTRPSSDRMNVPQGNSGAGVAGQSGNKNGPNPRSSTGTTGSGTGSNQDASRVPGLAGSKSGPAVKPSDPGSR